MSATKKDFKEILNDRLRKVIKEINEAKEGKVDFEGRSYATVALRNKKMREEFGFEIKTTTEILHNDNLKVIIKATISILMEQEWVEVATGHSEEYRRQDIINSSAATENAETSAIGRALAFLGLSGDEALASAEEIGYKTDKVETPVAKEVPKDKDKTSLKEAPKNGTESDKKSASKARLRTKQQKEDIEKLEFETEIDLKEITKEIGMKSNWRNKEKFLDEINLMEAGEIIKKYKTKETKRTKADEDDGLL